MKKTFITLAIIFGLGLCSYAQGGGLFGYGAVSEEEDDYYTAWYAFGQEQEFEDNSLFRFLKGSSGLPGLPTHNEDENQDAPLGSGALLLVGFGAAYALKKRKLK